MDFKFDFQTAQEKSLISTLIKQVMSAKALSQQGLADAIGASLSRVKAITSGRVAKLKQEEIKALVEELHVSAMWLTTGSGDMFEPTRLEETQDQFIDRMQAIAATSRLIDGLPLGAAEKDHLKLLLTGDPIKDGLLVAQALQGPPTLSPEEQALIDDYKGSSSGDQAAIRQLAKSVSRASASPADTAPARRRATGGSK